MGNPSVFPISSPGARPRFRIAGLGSLPGAIQPGPNGQIGAPSTDTAQALAIARGRLASGLDIAASNKATIGKYGFRTFPGMFSDDLSALAGDNTPAAKAGPNAYDRQIETVKNLIAQLDLEAQGAGKTSQAIEELKTAHQLNDAAMKANIPVTQQMRDQWKSYADTIAALNLQIKEQKALQEEQFKGATMFMSPSQSAAAGVAHGIDPNNWQAHMSDPAAQTAALISQMQTAQGIATSFTSTFADGMVHGATATQSLMNALQGLEGKLLNLAEDQLINGLFGGPNPGSPGSTGGLFSLFTLLGALGPSPQLAAQNAMATGASASDLAYAFHSGGIVGSGGEARYVHPGHFDAAPRFHSGGFAGDEVPIIAQRGEGVFTKAQMASMGGHSPVNINVVNNHSSAAVDVQQQKRPDGGVDIYAVITDAVNKHVASGGLDGAMRGRYGAQIRPRAR